jgi:Amt family ammonium transporter
LLINVIGCRVGQGRIINGGLFIFFGITGLIAGMLYLWSSDLLIKFKIDEAVDAIPVHMTSGIWGLLAVGLLAQPEKVQVIFGADAHPGFLYSLVEGNSDARLLACQVLGITFIFGWTFVTMLPFFLWLNFMGWFRIESVQELVGLDIAYNAGAGGEGKLTGDDDDVKEEYMDAYQRYRQNTQNNRSKGSPRKRSADEDDSDE